MHELSLIKNILVIVEEAAAAQNLARVTKVTLQIGALRQVVPEFLRFAFTTIATGTIVEGATLVIDIIPTSVLCRVCDRQFDVANNDNIYICPFCQNVKLEVVRGKEIIVANIEGEKT